MTDVVGIPRFAIESLAGIDFRLAVSQVVVAFGRSLSRAMARQDMYKCVRYTRRKFNAGCILARVRYYWS